MIITPNSQVGHEGAHDNQVGHEGVHGNQIGHEGAHGNQVGHGAQKVANVVKWVISTVSSWVSMFTDVGSITHSPAVTS